MGKRTLPVYLSVLLALFVGAGCRRLASASRPEIVFAYMKGSDARYYQNAVAVFQKQNPDLAVRGLPIAGSDYYEKLLVLMASHEAPDVMWIGQGFGEFASRGVFAAMDGWVRRDPALRAENFLPAVTDWYRLNGRLYGFPFGVDMDFIVYNEDLFDAAGLPYPRDDWTTAEFLRTAQRLTRRDASGKITQYGFQGGLDFSVFGASLLTPDHKRPAVQSPAMLAYLQFSRDLVSKWHVSLPRDRIELEEQKGLQAFQAGRVAMMVGHTWTLPDLRERMGKTRWDIAPPPRVPGLPTAHWASSQGLCISQDSRHKEAAWRLVRFLVTSDIFRPLMGELYPTNRLLADRLVHDRSQRPYHKEVMRRATRYLHPRPRVPNLTELTASYTDACDRVFLGRASPADAMRAAAAEMTETLNRRY